MYVCICKAVDETELKAAMDLTAASDFSLEGVQKACGAGTDCGSCRFKIERHMRQYKASCEVASSDSQPLKVAN